MKTLTFNSKESAEIFKSSTKVKGSYEELEDGSVILAYKYDAPCEVESEKANASYEAQQEYLEECVYNAMSSMESYFNNRISYVHDRIDNIGRALAQHSKGHLPAIKSASQMESALKGLGLDGEYEVKKGQIHVEAGDNSMTAYY